MWILDFDKAEAFTLDENPIPKLKRGVCGNEPYFPHPKHSKALYEEFAKVYLAVSRAILRERVMSEEILRLPERFLQAYEAWADEDEVEIVFGFD